MLHAASFPQAKPQSDLQFQLFAPADAARLGQLIERTTRTRSTVRSWTASGHRRRADRLSRNRANTGLTGGFLLGMPGQDVGCVLLADHPEHDQAELMYLGIVPEMRGRGWGRQITRYAQWLIGQVPRERMVLAVDDNNWPAQSVYSPPALIIGIGAACTYAMCRRALGREASGTKHQHVFHDGAPGRRFFLTDRDRISRGFGGRTRGSRKSLWSLLYTAAQHAYNRLPRIITGTFVVDPKSIGRTTLPKLWNRLLKPAATSPRRSGEWTIGHDLRVVLRRWWCAQRMR